MAFPLESRPIKVKNVEALFNNSVASRGNFPNSAGHELKKKSFPVPTVWRNNFSRRLRYGFHLWNFKELIGNNEAKMTGKVYF